MGKFVKTIAKMVDVAERNGESSRGAYEVINNDLTKTISLYHYGTMTAKVVEGRLVEAYGISSSDADSVETFLSLTAYKLAFNVNFGYKPVNGGFYAGVSGLCTYLGEANNSEAFADSIMNRWGLI